MSKSRFSTTDTKAMVRDIRATLLGQRVANIYDLNDKTYLFKFAVPGKSEKVLLLLESGIRFHTTKYARDKSDLPSPFAMKLRKHIRTRRLEDVRQLCNDRIVDFKFGSGDSVFHIILELYANGNIILADGNYEILALLRTHQFEEDVAIRVNEIYPVAFATTTDTALLNRSTAGITSDVTTGVLDEGETAESPTALNMDPAAFVQWAQQRDADSGAWALSAPPSKATGGGKKNKAKKMTMRQLLLSRDSGVSSYGPEILDHCLLTAGVKVATKVCDFISDTEALVIAASILKEIRAAESLLQSLDIPGQRGYVLYNKTLGPAPALTLLPSSAALLNGLEPPVSEAAAAPSPAQVEIMQFMDFVPRIFLQHEGQAFLEYSSFDEAVDEYYCKVWCGQCYREAVLNVITTIFSRTNPTPYSPVICSKVEEQKLERVAVSAEETARKKVSSRLTLIS
jgi:NFACT N-terminal and middle domains